MAEMAEAETSNYAYQNGLDDGFKIGLVTGLIIGLVVGLVAVIFVLLA